MRLFPIDRSLCWWDLHNHLRPDAHRLAWMWIAHLACLKQTGCYLEGFIDTLLYICTEKRIRRIQERFKGAIPNDADERQTLHDLLESQEFIKEYGVLALPMKDLYLSKLRYELPTALRAGEQLFVLKKLDVHHPDCNPSLRQARRAIGTADRNANDWTDAKSVSHIAAAVLLVMEQEGMTRWSEATYAIKKKPWLIYSYALSFQNFALGFKAKHGKRALPPESLLLIDLPSVRGADITNLIQPLSRKQLGRLRGSKS